MRVELECGLIIDVARIGEEEKGYFFTVMNSSNLLATGESRGEWSTWQAARRAAFLILENSIIELRETKFNETFE